MRTLTLLTALLLLAFQVRAQVLQETTEQVPTQDQLGVEDQDLLGDEDQDVAVSFPGEERFTRQLTGDIVKSVVTIVGKKIAKEVLRKCHCRRQQLCPRNKVNRVLQRASGVCRIFGRQYKLCCR